MIKIILEDSSSKKIEVISLSGNERYLIRSDFQLLGRIDSISYDTFSSEEMDILMKELQTLRSELSNADELDHVDAIQRLAIKCRNLPGFTLTFTPFDN